MNQVNFQLFEELEQAKGKAKQDVLRKFGAQERRLLKLALDPLYKFKTTKISEKRQYMVELYGPESQNISNFFELAERLAAKKALTKEEKDGVQIEIDTFTDDVARKWLRRILLKDLQCGVDVKTVNKVWPDLCYWHPVALANRFEPDKKKFQKLDLYNYVVDAKLDGVRATFKINEQNELEWARSRNGLEIENVPDIVKELQLIGPGVYDGEIYWHVHNGFQKLMKYISADDPIPSHIPYRYIIFDYIPLDEWGDYRVQKKTAYGQRLTILFKRVRQLLVDGAFSFCAQPNDFVQYFGSRLGHTLFHKIDNALGANEKLEQAVHNGYEGIMLKNVNGLYTPDRSDNILKYKEMYTENKVEEEATVVGVYEGKGKRLGLVGGLVARGPNGALFRCGSGLTDAMLKKIAADPESYTGRIFEYIQEKELTEDGKPRFPVFQRFRTDIEKGL